MTIKRKRPSPKPTSGTSDKPPPTPWYRRAWVLLSFLGAGLYGLLANGPTLLANAEKLPADFERVSTQFLAWHYKDREWEGLWSAGPEGYVDSGDMKLSDVDIKLHLSPERGRIGGEIAMKSICQSLPIFDYLLLEGKVSGDTAMITAFDFIGGERKNFFHFTAKRDGVVITISEVGSPEWLPAAPARIAQHPPVEGFDPYTKLHGTCRLEREEFVKKIRPYVRPSGSGREPVELLSGTRTR